MADENLISVPLTGLRAGKVTGFDIYLQTRSGQTPVLFRNKTLPLTDGVLDQLAELKHERLFIPESDGPAYRRYLEDNLPGFLADDSIAVEAKCGMVYECAKNLMSDVMEEPRAKGVIARCRSLVESTVDFIGSEDTSFRHLLRVVSYDYYTYTHSVNVFVFSTALALHAGFDDDATLRSFGEGALLHDVGKSEIDASILNCAGRLSEEQWAIMKQHPDFGCRILGSQNDMGDLALDVVRHHHEKLSGAGYPDGLKNGDISPLVRIATIADIFDALTTRRSYKAALQSFPALALMKNEMADELDSDLFRMMVQLMSGAVQNPG